MKAIAISVVIVVLGVVTIAAFYASIVPAPRVITSTTTIGGQTYNLIDVSSDTTVQDPSYSYFHNGTITFDGVRFGTVCSRSYQGCPGYNPDNFTTVTLAVFKFNMTFSDGTTEFQASVIRPSSPVYMLSNHNSPRAGIVIDYFDQSYHVYLLVSKR